MATGSGQAVRLVGAEARRAIREWGESHKAGRAKRGHLGVTWSDTGLLLTWSGSAFQQPDDIAGFVGLALLLRSPVRNGW